MRNFLEMTYFIMCLMLISIVMGAVFLFSFRFFLMFGPFIVLFDLIKNLLRRAK